MKKKILFITIDNIKKNFLNSMQIKIKDYAHIMWGVKFYGNNFATGRFVAQRARYVAANALEY